MPTGGYVSIRQYSFIDRYYLQLNARGESGTMTEGIIIAIITAGLSLVGVMITVIYGNKKTANTVKVQTDLTLYRIEQLEKKQEIHNNVIERMYKAEENIKILQEKYKVEKHRINDLEEYHKPK